MNYLALPLAALLAGCSPSILAGAADVVSTSPAPLERTVLDEKAVTLAAQAVDAAALSASALARTGIVRPGSDTALAMARALDTARDGVNAAELARQAGSESSYSAALAKATAAIADLKTILASIGA